MIVVLEIPSYNIEMIFDTNDLLCAEIDAGKWAIYITLTGGVKYSIEYPNFKKFNSGKKQIIEWFKNSKNFANEKIIK